LVDPDTLDRRLAKLEELLQRLRKLALTPEADFLANNVLQSATERSLHLAAECCIDIAHHIIADRGWTTPTTYKEAFQILADNGVLEEELCADMQDWAGLRNVLVHLYLDVDQKRLYEILQQDLNGLETYAGAIVKFAR